MAILIVAVFPSRLSRYRLLGVNAANSPVSQKQGDGIVCPDQAVGVGPLFAEESARNRPLARLLTSPTNVTVQASNAA